MASGGHSSSRCAGLPPPQPHLLWSTGSRRAGSATVAHGPSRSAACGILPDQGSNPCPLHWQADSQPLRHQGSPLSTFALLLGMENRFENDNDCLMMNFKNKNLPYFFQSFQLLATGFLYKAVGFKILKQRKRNLLVSGVSNCNI